MTSSPRPPALFALLAAMLVALIPGSARAAQENTVLVLDVSNSMWGQVEGRSKIEIARAVIADLVTDWPASRQLGLVAYGHRRAGDCTDIETVIPVGSVEPQSLVSTVNNLTPKGKTPLTNAVRQAAEVLRYADVPATVILVSDGIESCRADPCALATELEKGGVDFTAHVIGFDIEGVQDKGQLECLAANTGGKFLTAQTADELAEALKEVSIEEPATEADIILEALDGPGGAPLTGADLAWTVVGLDTEETVLDNAPQARPELKLKPGQYFARATLGKAAGEVQFTVDETLAPATHQVVLSVPVSLSAPESVESGSTVQVDWEGPGRPADYLAFARPEDRDDAYLTYARFGRASPTALKAPTEPGAFEIRYVDGKARKVLARVAVRVIDITATVEAPESIEITKEFRVAWDGPDGAGDFIAVADPKGSAGQFTAFARTKDGKTLVLKAPGKPGDYEVRYVFARDQRILARVPLVVTDIPATLKAPPTAGAGSEIPVEWTGPDGKGDFITIVAPQAPDHKYGNYAYTRKGPVATLRMPDAPGDYELRYFLNSGRRVLARLPITVEAVSATLQAKPTVSAGSEVSVTWTGPDNRNDFITMVPAGTEGGRGSGSAYTGYGNWSYTKKGSPAKLRAPEEPGDYELRYIMGQSYSTLARASVSVEAVTAKLEAPPTAAAGSELAVTWTGPDNQNDFITVVAPGTAEGKHGKYAYTRNGSPLKIRMPDEPGNYELRYVMGQSRKTLARLAITIGAVEAKLEAPPSAPAGSDLAVTWTGPDNRGDFITVVATGTAEGKYGRYTYTRNGSPAKVRMPDEPGDYELRYIMAQSRKTLARLPIAIGAVNATLEAPPAVKAGNEVPVVWTGPDNKGDFVTVVTAGTAEKKFGKYAYTRNGSPAKVMVPDEPGSYEFRYIMGQSRKTLARLAVTVEDVTATLEAPPSAQANADILVTWTGPGNRRDYVTIVPVGTPDNKHGKYSYTRNKSPVRIRAPKEPGAYELRYVMGQSRRILARLPIILQ